jgi:phage repressor protein C with HTH and peptisase S24 domain
MNMIKELREKQQLTQSDLAELVGTSQPQIKRLETGERKLTKEWAEKIGPKLGVTAEILMFGWPEDSAPHLVEPPPIYEDSPFHLPNAQIHGKVEGVGRKIPVYGQAVGGVDGEFVMNGSVLFEVLAPPSVSASSGAYAVMVSGDSMYPRYEDGEICFVDPKRRVKKGDYVIVQIKTEDEGPLLAFVKRFIRHNAVELVLEQFNPAKELRFPSSQVQSVHYVALAGSA